MIIQDSLNASFNIDNDYQDILFQWGQKDQVDLSVSGGSDKIKYYGSTGYYNERGIVPNTGFQRLTARLNADYNANSWLTLHSRVSLGYSQKNGINEGQLMTAMLSRRPYFNLYYPDGSLAGVFQGQKSPLAQVEYTTDRTEYYKVNFYQGFEVKLAKGLTFSTNINANLYLDKRRRVYPSMITDEWQKSNMGYSNDNLNWNWLNENVLTYKNSWGGHNFTAMVGFSEQQWRYDRNVLSGINSSSDFLTTMNAFSANLILSETGAWQQNHAMASLFARVNYDYKSRYLVQATVRRDGSSRFSKKNRWGNFPSVSAAWRLSDEPFMKFSRRVLDDAKIRVSWGVTGNEQIGNYDYLYSYTTGDIYDGIGGVYPARLAVDNLRWEETRQTDVGLDLSFFGQRLTLTADYYDKYTDGLLANLELPKESGFGSMRTNIGEVRNRGFELSVAGDLVRTRDFRWNASFNISRNWNSIERLSTGEPYLEGDLWWMQEGGSVGDFYGYRQLGIFRYDQSNAFTPDTWQQLTPVFEGASSAAIRSTARPIRATSCRRSCPTASLSAAATSIGTRLPVRATGSSTRTTAWSSATPCPPIRAVSPRLSPIRTFRSSCRSIIRSAPRFTTTPSTSATCSSIRRPLPRPMSSTTSGCTRATRRFTRGLITTSSTMRVTPIRSTSKRAISSACRISGSATTCPSGGSSPHASSRCRSTSSPTTPSPGPLTAATTPNFRRPIRCASARIRTVIPTSVSSARV